MHRQGKSTTRGFAHLFLVAQSCLSIGCASSRPVQFTSMPSGAVVSKPCVSVGCYADKIGKTPAMLDPKDSPYYRSRKERSTENLEYMLTGNYFPIGQPEVTWKNWLLLPFTLPVTAAILAGYTIAYPFRVFGKASSSKKTSGMLYLARLGGRYVEVETDENKVHFDFSASDARLFSQWVGQSASSIVKRIGHPGMKNIKTLPDGQQIWDYGDMRLRFRSGNSDLHLEHLILEEVLEPVQSGAI